ncbi:MAG: HYR domain-containing protein, partial [Bacteroidota bacterium]
MKKYLHATFLKPFLLRLCNLIKIVLDNQINLFFISSKRGPDLFQFQTKIWQAQKFLKLRLAFLMIVGCWFGALGQSQKIGSVVIGSSTNGTCGTVSFDITVFRGTGGGSSGTFYADLSFTVDVPGLNYSFSPVSYTNGGVPYLDFTAQDNSKSTVLTISDIPYGATITFTVRADNSQSPQPDFSTATYTFTNDLAACCIKPSFTACPADITMQCPGTADYTATAIGQAAFGNVSYIYSFTGATSENGSGTGSGRGFNFGTTNVTVTATNICGSTQCSFTVNVNDTEAPIISCPSNINQNVEVGLCSAIVSFNPATAFDNCSGLVNITQIGGPSSGSAFPVGTTT